MTTITRKLRSSAGKGREAQVQVVLDRPVRAAKRQLGEEPNAPKKEPLKKAKSEEKEKEKEKEPGAVGDQMCVDANATNATDDESERKRDLASIAALQDKIADLEKRIQEADARKEAAEAKAVAEAESLRRVAANTAAKRVKAKALEALEAKAVAAEADAAEKAKKEAAIVETQRLSDERRKDFMPPAEFARYKEQRGTEKLLLYVLMCVNTDTLSRAGVLEKEKILDAVWNTYKSAADEKRRMSIRELVEGSFRGDDVHRVMAALVGAIRRYVLVVGGVPLDRMTNAKIAEMPLRTVCGLLVTKEEEDRAEESGERLFHGFHREAVANQAVVGYQAFVDSVCAAIRAMLAEFSGPFSLEDEIAERKRLAVAQARSDLVCVSAHELDGLEPDASGGYGIAGRFRLQTIAVLVDRAVIGGPLDPMWHEQKETFYLGTDSGSTALIVKLEALCEGASGGASGRAVSEAVFDAFVAAANLQQRRLCVRREVCDGPCDPRDVEAAETLYMAPSSKGLCALDKLLAQKAEEKRDEDQRWSCREPAPSPSYRPAARVLSKPKQRRVSMALDRDSATGQFSPTAPAYSPLSPGCGYSCTKYNPTAPCYER